MWQNSIRKIKNIPLKHILHLTIVRKILIFLTTLLIPIQNIYKQDVVIITNKGNRDALGLFLVYARLKYMYKLKIKIHSAVFLGRFWILLYRPTVVVHIVIDCIEGVKIYEFLNRMGCLKLMLPTENVAMYDAEEILVNKYPLEHFVDGIFLSGDAIKNIYLKNNKISEKKIYVVGSPTFDWCVPPFNDYFMNKATFLKKYKIPKNRKLILLATSFSEADLNMRNYSTEYFNMVVPKQIFLNYHEASKRIRVILINFFPSFLKKRPEWHLLIKKHPAEKKDLYLSFWTNHPQITHVHEEDIHTLLAHCDVLIHRNSTTSIQAWGFNKPTILLNPEEINRIFSKTTQLTNFQKGNYICSNLEKLDTILTDIFYNRPLPYSQIISRNSYITKWFYKMDGESARRMAKIIHQLFVKNKQRKIAYKTCLIDPLHLLYGFLQIPMYKIKFYLVWICYRIPYCPQNIIHTLGKSYDNFFIEFHILKLGKKIKKHILYEKNT